MQEMRVCVEEANREEIEFLTAELVKFNEARAGKRQFKELSVLLKGDDGAVLGGLTGFTAWGWLYIDIFFVPEDLRHKGLGTQILKRVEQEAKARGCCGAHLYCYEFQNLSFYERHGYQIFGCLTGYPAGFKRYYLAKQRLDAGAA